MPLRCAFAIVMALLVSTLLTSSQAPAAVKGATTLVTNVDTANHTYTFEVTNTSSQEITAFAVAYSHTYTDGTTIKGEFLKDWGAFQWADHKTLQPGGKHVQVLSLEKSAVDAHVELVLVAYADQTVEVGAGGENMFKDLVARRSAFARGFQKSADVIEDALNSPDDAPVATALQTIKGIRNDVNSKRSQAIDDACLVEAMNRLQASPRGAGERDYLRRQLTELQSRAEVTRNFAQVRRLP